MTSQIYPLKLESLICRVFSIYLSPSLVLVLRICYSDSQAFAFDKVETRQFIPNPEYIANCVAAEPVQRYYGKSRYKKPVYLITGVKHVSGCKGVSALSRATGAKFHVEADGNVLSGGVVPIGGGPDMGVQRGNSTETSWAESTDFVFAFRVQKLTVEKKTGEATSRDYLKGAMLGTNEQAKAKELPFVVTGVEAPGPDELGLEAEAIEDDDGNICVVPRQMG